MLDFAIVSLLLLPNLILAVTSRAGKHAGYYLLAGMFALAVIGGVWPIAFFAYAAAVLVLTAVLFRDRQRIGEFFAQRANARHR